jgi:hypothetical protein
VELGSADVRRQKMGLSITRCIVQFGEIARYGKKSPLFRENLRPQYLVVKVRLTDWHISINFRPNTAVSIPIHT